MEPRPEPPDKHKLKSALAIFIACLALYALTAYGGIRSPDNEVVFRAALSFADHLDLDVAKGLEDWEGFGVAQAKNGRLYPIFGPAESIALAPFVLAGLAINRSEWYKGVDLPPSHYVDKGLYSALEGGRLQDPESHALRLICSLYNIVVCSLCAVVFFMAVLRLVGSSMSAAVTTGFLAFGSLMWPYSGTFFSEPFALLFVLLSFYLSIGYATGREKDLRPTSMRIFGAGLCLGIAASAHITAVLFIPFFTCLVVIAAIRQNRSGALRATMLYAFGLGIALAALGYYNYSRFGSFVETGRSAIPGSAAEFGYGAFVAPWRGLYGLLFGSAKGLFLYSPAVLLGLISWPVFHRKFALLSWTLIGAIILRVLFVASRSDWHGGFCLGPRYLLMILPFMLLPLGVAIDERLRKGDLRIILWVGIAFVLCMAQQVYFCTGEIFSFFHSIKFWAFDAGINIFKNDRIYLDWSFSPLLNLLKERRGPFLLGDIGLSNVQLWLLISLLLSAPALAWAIRFQRRDRSV